MGFEPIGAHCREEYLNYYATRAVENESTAHLTGTIINRKELMKL